MKNRVITTLMSRAGLAAAAAATMGTRALSVERAAPPPQIHQPTGDPKYRMGGDCTIAWDSSLRKRMRAARHIPVKAPPPQADKYLNSHARAMKALKTAMEPRR